MSNEITSIKDFCAKYDESAPCGENFVNGQYVMRYVHQPDDSEFVALICRVAVEGVYSLEDFSYDAVESATFIEHQIITLTDEEKQQCENNDAVMMRMNRYNALFEKGYEIQKQMIMNAI